MSLFVWVCCGIGVSGLMLLLIGGAGGRLRVVREVGSGKGRSCDAIFR